MGKSLLIVEVCKTSVSGRQSFKAKRYLQGLTEADGVN